MSHKRGKKRKEKTQILIEYYNHYFLHLHSQLSKTNIDFRSFPDECKTFWNVVPPREYSQLEGLQILTKYLTVLEDKIASKIRKQSIGYWLHLYRRISPRAIGQNDDPMTILNVRSTVEAAFQKYGKIGLCDKIAFSDEIDVSKILKGFLLHPSFGMIRKHINEKPQFVLTDFGLEDLIELYNVERIGYEIWRTMATMRTIGKGARFAVVTQEPYYVDIRSEELSFLISFFDNKSRENDVSMNGVMFDSNPLSASTGLFLLAFYNVNQSTVEPIRQSLKALKLSLPNTFIPNFLLGPYNFKDFFENHLYFSEVFKEKTNIELIHLMRFLGALLYGLLLQFQTDKWFILKIFQRAYEGPYPKEDILQSISNYLKSSNKYLDLENNDLNFDVEQIFNYLSVNENIRDSIDISLAGPLKMFIPVGDNRYFIDYAWLSRIFYTLFWKINPSDQNFKGLALEKQIHRRRSILTIKQCKSIAGTSKQIDASFEMGGYLIIVECRAKGRSFGLDKGDIQAIQMRQSFINDSLADIDEKAKWLLENPIGLNYDISNYKGILPVLVSPFIEFIPSLQKFYWIDNKTSRVMAPSELDKFLSKTISDKEFSLFNNIYWNTSKLIVTG